MPNNDGFQQLLEVLKLHPEYIRQLVFDSQSLKAQLPSGAAKKLAGGVVDASTFLDNMAGSADDVAQYSPQAQSLCAQGTLFQVLSCGGGTNK